MEHSILYCEKENWYEKNRFGKRIWNFILVESFWNVLNEAKIKKGDFIFSDIIFPTFNTSNSSLNPKEDFFLKHIEKAKSPTKTMLGDVHFGNIQSAILFERCKFVGDLNLWYTNFNNRISMHNCIFEGEVRLQSLIVVNFITITDCQFYNEFYMTELIALKSFSITGKTFFKRQFLLMNNTIKGTFSVSESIFHSFFQISHSNFHSRTDLGQLTFEDECTLFQNTHHGGLNISSPKFYKYLKISTLKLKNGTLNDPFFAGIKYFFDDIKMIEDTKFRFIDCNFNKDFTIKNCQIQDFIFGSSDLTSLRFLSIEWGKSSRLIIHDEIINPIPDNSNLQILEDNYRQIKTNFDNTQDWELSGKAYMSEMKMRERRLWLESDYLSYLIFKIYNLLGYTQNFKQPMIIFLFLNFIIFPIYYYFYDKNKYINTVYTMGENIEIAMQKSFSASLPIINSELNYENWWVKAIQSLISVILLTFFILALRKRFKT